MLTGILDNLLLNGDFLPELWTRLPDPRALVECPTWRQTFAVDRWKIRYAMPHGAGIRQAMSSDVPMQAAAARSLELRGATGVTQPVFLGQRIEAAEAVRYRRRMIFSAWMRIEHPDKGRKEVALTIGTARDPDVFGNAFNDNVRNEVSIRCEEAPVSRWWLIERDIDGRGFDTNGISVELEFPADLLDTPDARIRVAAMRLTDASAAGRSTERAAGVERLLARRFFQRHDSTTVNSLGRALVVNAHELHFQFTFAEMRAFPAVTLTHDEAQLSVFNLEGTPQTGFSYDVTYRSRGSVILRATKENHGLRDGFLSFVGTGGAILLDAEL